MNIWEQIKQQVAYRISPEAFHNWLARTSLIEENPETLRISVPDEAAKLWIEREYADFIRGAMTDLRLPFHHVAYQVTNGNGFAHSSRTMFSPAADGPAAQVSFSSAITQLNQRFTFDSFVVGSCNQFAHAAAKAVATQPSRSYNPLFIYGGSGMGKTHLMHAIGHHLLTTCAGIRLVYTSSERFMNEMVSCIKLEKMSQFHQHYRSADVLLIDDIHILGGKERTQEEFFHTFNELYEHSKQIVISSDSPPKNTPGLVERLRSRFEWGLMVDVQPPDLETKMAILDKKSEAEGVRLPEDVRVFIATKTKSNVRELEGALVKLIAYSSVTNSPITMPMAQQVLKHLVQPTERRITIENVIRAVADKFQLQPSQIKQVTNAQEIAFPRQIAMYIAKDLTYSSLPQIGKAFSGKHHTTVLHGIQKVERLRQQNPDLNKLIQSVIDTLQGS